MGMFNFIETFFFVSLGITFVLILLLVYHFKQRINGLEQKCDTMFEIINNIVQEITYLKNAQMAVQYRLQTQQCVPTIHGLHPNVFINNQSPMNIIKTVDDKIMVSDNEDDEDSIDDSVDDESCDLEKDDSEEDSDDECCDNEEYTHIPAVKIINIENVQDFSSQLNIETLSVEKITHDNSELIEVDPIEHTLTTHQLNYETKPIVSEDSVRESYRKMTLPALKAYVIEKGFCTDPSKMKKPELIKLVEDSM